MFVHFYVALYKMLRRLLGLFRRKPPNRTNNARRVNSPARRNNNVRRVNSPRRSPPRNNMVMYNGQIMTVNGMEQLKAYKRLLRAGYSNAAAWKAVGGR
jgi:hypothetical protein